MAEMPDYGSIEEKILRLTGASRRPVAIAFLDRIPAGVARFEGSEPSSCSYWRLAAAGRTFYTIPADHWNCPIGGYTHNTLSGEQMPDLQQVLTLMSDIGYVRPEEIPGVFKMESAPAAILYGPLGEFPAAPSVVLVSARPGRLMMLSEAALRAGAMSRLPLLGRPTCMAIPASLANGAVASTGCIGNRVYTDIADDELYLSLRGSDLPGIAAEIDTIERANATLTAYHQDRRQALSSV